jgi:hypothetical protein
MPTAIQRRFTRQRCARFELLEQLPTDAQVDGKYQRVRTIGVVDHGDSPQVFADHRRIRAVV